MGDVTNNRFYRQKLAIPKTKEEFASMLIRDYRHSEKLANDCAAIVAGFGAFDEPPEAYEKARVEKLYGWDEGKQGLEKGSEGQSQESRFAPQ